MPGMTWTEEQDQRLRRLWREGKSTREIGEIMGITKNSVVGRAHRLKLAPRPAAVLRGDRSPGAVSKREATKAKAIELYQDGLQRAQIAAQLELNPDYVSNLLRGVSQRSAPQPRNGGKRQALPVGACAPVVTLPAGQISTPPAAPRVQFRPIEPRCCKWPLCNDKERPTHRYCEGPTTTRKDGLPDVYCAAHRAKATAKTLWYATAPRFAA